MKYDHTCEQCSRTLTYFDRVGHAEVFECTQCERAWYFYHDGQVVEVEGWRRYAK